jgi:hypothetical protein
MAARWRALHFNMHIENAAVGESACGRVLDNTPVMIPALASKSGLGAPCLTRTLCDQVIDRDQADRLKWD